MPEKQITKMEQVFFLADLRLAVWHGEWKRHVPAAVVQHTGARKLQQLIDDGMLWTYRRKADKQLPLFEG